MISNKVYQSRPDAYPETMYIVPIGEYGEDGITYKQGVVTGDAILFYARRCVMPKAEFETNFVIKDGVRSD